MQLLIRNCVSLMEISELQHSNVIRLTNLGSVQNLQDFIHLCALDTDI